MCSNLTKAVLVLLIAILGGHLYNESYREEEILSLGNVSILQLNQLVNIQYTKNMEKKLKAFVLGATGAVGKELVKALGADTRFEKVVLIGRREVPLNPIDNPGHAKIENKLVDFEKLEEHKETFKGFDVGFCALGTTLRQSGSKGFYRVDHDYVVGSAKLAKEGGCQHFHLVSSAGAKKSSYGLYMRTKGEVEAELTEMDFPRLSIYRPGFLMVEEAREGGRTLEVCLQKLFYLDRARWFSIEVPLFAKVMAENCFRESPSKVELVYNDAIKKFGKELTEGKAKAHTSL